MSENEEIETVTDINIAIFQLQRKIQFDHFPFY